MLTHEVKEGKEDVDSLVVVSVVVALQHSSFEDDVVAVAEVVDQQSLEVPLRVEDADDSLFLN